MQDLQAMPGRISPLAAGCLAKDTFGKLGQECFHGLKEWVDSIGRHNIQKVIDDVNIRDLSPYWEKLQFNEDKSIL